MKILKIKFLFFTLLLIQISQVFANDIILIDKNLRFPNTNISTTISSFFPSFYQNTGTINLGAEIGLKQNSSLYFNGGYIFPYGPLRNRSFRLNTEHINGSHFQVEYRFYKKPKIDSKNPNKKHFKYGGINYNYTRTKAYRIQKVPDLETVDYDFFGPYSAVFHENNYEVNRISNGLAFRMGIKTLYKSGIFIDKSILMGLRYIQGNSINRLYGDLKFYSTNQREALIFKPYDYGSSIVPQLLFQIIIGFQAQK